MDFDGDVFVESCCIGEGLKARCLYEAGGWSYFLEDLLEYVGVEE